MSLNIKVDWGRGNASISVDSLNGNGDINGGVNVDWGHGGTRVDWGHGGINGGVNVDWGNGGTRVDWGHGGVNVNIF
jgi:hypothetical protein